MGEADGTPKSADWAAGISEIPAETIQDLARRFAKSRTMFASGWAMQRQHHGEQAHWMLVTLASMLGQIGLPGGGFGFSYHYASGGAPRQRARAERYHRWRQSHAGANLAWLASGAASYPGRTGRRHAGASRRDFDFNGTRAKYPDVKIAYWVGGNPFAHHQDRNRMLKAWQ